MNKAVLTIYTDDSTQHINKSTLKSLRDRGLLGDENKLTPAGRLYAVSKMHLPKQCTELSLELENVKLSYTGRPELALLAHYKSLGYIGISSEGIGVLTVLKALMLDGLANYNLIGGRDDACTRYLQAQFIILKDNIDEIILSISSTSKELYLSNFEEIISKPFIAYSYPELSMEFALAMYEAIDLNHYIAIGMKMAEDPYNYGKGWPDLTLIRENEVLFVEVKTTDKLHESQLVTIPTMRDILPFPFLVCKIKKVDNLNSSLDTSGENISSTSIPKSFGGISIDTYNE